jgi:hypothetical protein
MPTLVVGMLEVSAKKLGILVEKKDLAFIKSQIDKATLVGAAVVLPPHFHPAGREYNSRPNAVLSI